MTTKFIKFKGAVYRLAVAPIPKVLYHGTSRAAVSEMMSGGQSATRVYQDSNVSLGGAYFYLPSKLPHARVAASRAAREAGELGSGVVLAVRPIFQLLPDEDWVVAAVESLPTDRMGNIKNHRYRDFFNDLFQGYLGEGWSLSDHYKERYDELNATHGITWEDSAKWSGSVRQSELLVPEQILEEVS